MSGTSGTPAQVLSRAQACERLRTMQVPPAVLEVAKTLQEAGNAAVLVGGCVRDVLLGRSHNDWDLASSARPEEVQGLFKRTIATGIEHGTVTVMVGRGDAREGVEITTFRGENGFDDGRRPNEVVFLRELEDDLARRDFTINAFAWDPIGARFTDVYGGLADLNARRIRAVGDALARFLEDGLRVMRAVRFAATLAFELDPETEAAIAGALEVFDKVSRERVQVELFKLLAATEPSRGLAPMHRQGLWARVLGEPAGEADYAALAAGCDARTPDVAVRLAWLLAPVSGDLVESVLDGLKPSRKLRADVQRLLSPGVSELSSPETSPAQLRRRCSALGRAHVDAALDFLLAEETARQAVHQAIEGNAIGGKELKLAGRDLIAAGVMKPGRGLGDLLALLLEAVLEDPTLNTQEQLLSLARSRASEFG